MQIFDQIESLNLDNPSKRFAWSPNGSKLAIPTSTGIIYIFDYHYHKYKHIFNLFTKFDRNGNNSDHKQTIYSVAWSPDNNTLVSMSANNKICFWNIEEKRLIIEISHTDEVFSASFSPNNDFVVIGSKDRKIKIIELKDYSEVYNKSCHLRGIDSIIWLEQDIIISGSADADIKFWNFKDNNLESSGEIRRLNGSIHNLLFLKDKKLLIAACADGKIKVINNITKKIIGEIQAHNDEITSISIDHEGKIIASMSRDGSVSFWKNGSWHKISEFKTIPTDAELDETVWCRSLAFHPNKPLLAVADDKDKNIKIFKVNIKSLISQENTKQTRQTVTAKVVILGQNSIGKTALFNAFQGFWENTVTTHGANNVLIPVEREYLPKEKDWDTINAQIALWDFAGQQTNQLVNQLFLDNTHIGLFVCDSKDAEYLSDYSESSLLNPGAWSQVLKYTSPTALIYLVFSRSDLNKPIIKDSLEEFLRKKEIHQKYFVTSALKSEGIKELLDNIKNNINWNTIIKQTHQKVFPEITNFILKQRENYICISTSTLETKLKEQYPRSDITKEATQQAVQYLRDFGIIYTINYSESVYMILKLDLLVKIASDIISQAIHNEIQYTTIEKIIENPSYAVIRPEEKIVLSKLIVKLLIDRRVCFEYDKSLIFPSLLTRLPLPKELKEQLTTAIPFVNFYLSGNVSYIYSDLICLLKSEMFNLSLKPYDQVSVFSEDSNHKDSSKDKKIFVELKYIEISKKSEAYLKISLNRIEKDTDGDFYSHFIFKIQNFLEKIHQQNSKYEIINSCQYEDCKKTIAKEIIIYRTQNPMKKKDFFTCPWCDNKNPIITSISSFFSTRKHK